MLQDSNKSVWMLEITSESGSILIGIDNMMNSWIWLRKKSICRRFSIIYKVCRWENKLDVDDAMKKED
jgi:hypothetical protein